MSNDVNESSQARLVSLSDEEAVKEIIEATVLNLGRSSTISLAFGRRGASDIASRFSDPRAHSLTRSCTRR